MSVEVINDRLSHVCMRDVKCVEHDEDYFPSDCKMCQIKCVGCRYSCSCVKYRKIRYIGLVLTCDHCFENGFQKELVILTDTGEISYLEFKEGSERLLEIARWENRELLACSICGCSFTGARLVKFVHDVVCGKCLTNRKCEWCGSENYVRGFLCENFFDKLARSDHTSVDCADQEFGLELIKSCLTVVACSDCKLDVSGSKCGWCDCVICNNCSTTCVCGVRLCGDCQRCEVCDPTESESQSISVVNLLPR